MRKEPHPLSVGREKRVPCSFRALESRGLELVHGAQIEQRGASTARTSGLDEVKLRPSGEIAIRSLSLCWWPSCRGRASRVTTGGLGRASHQTAKPVTSIAITHAIRSRARLDGGAAHRSRRRDGGLVEDFLDFHTDIPNRLTTVLAILPEASAQEVQDPWVEPRRKRVPIRARARARDIACLRTVRDRRSQQCSGGSMTPAPSPRAGSVSTFPCPGRIHREVL